MVGQALHDGTGALLGSALLTLLVAFVLCAVFPFPKAWGMIWAVAISSVVQLSAVWIPPEQRPHAMEGGRA